MSAASGIVIVGCGLFTPVGLSARETAASTRARTARLTSIEWRDKHFERFTVGILPDDALPPLHPELETLPLTYRESRMLRLAGPALQEAAAPLPGGGGRVPLLLGLPELHTTIPLKESAFLSRLARQSGVAINLEKSVAFPIGRAGALVALGKACEMLGDGSAESVLVGGVDCQVDLYILGTLDMQNRVRTDMNPDGFAPGEGAGFVLLTKAGRAREPIARLLGFFSAKEEGHLQSEKPYRGDGLASAFEGLFAAVPDAPKVGCVYVGFNGEHYWAKEFGVSILRNHGRFSDGYKTEHPAECFGDLGAAHGAVMLGLAALHVKRTCAATATLVSASSDLGDRGVALLATSQSG